MQPDLVGGSEATGDTGWMAAVQYDAPAYGRYARFQCGASLVFRSWVVTGAHCVTDMPGNTGAVPTSAKTYSVRVGSKDRTQDGEIAKVVQVVVHPGWHWAAGAPKKPVDDIALLKLDHPVNSQPIPLAGRAASPVRCADVPQSAGEICTSNPHGTDGPGRGDSGGPAVASVDGVPQLVGTCSRAAAQYPGVKPTVYTSPPDFRTWIYDTARGTPATA